MGPARFSFDGPREHHEGYAYDGLDGRRVEVPATKTPAAAYANAPMTRERAQDVAIAYGVVVSEGLTPIRIRPNGAGYDALIPMEVIEAIPVVADYLKRWDA